jgi:enoyl-CoA hydratase
MSATHQTAPAAAPKVEVTRHGAAVAITLNRPQALNAFDDEMRQIFAAEIPKLARNPDVYVVILKSASAKAFCAGGDVRALVKTAASDKARAASYFAGEYQLNWLLDCFSKPTVSLIDGLCMGSGAGLTCFNTHRVAGANYKFAMPETAIGLFPDVGVAHVLARLPQPLGLYLGLTGRTIGRADAHWLGLVTHCVSADRFPEIVAALADAQPIDQLLDGMHESVEPGPMQAERQYIEAFFSGASIGEIFTRLERASGAGATFAAASLADLRKRSPISLHLTDRHIRSAAQLDLRETLIQDYRLAVRCLDARDFAEGVRAALVDKDGHPKWQHPRIEDVTDHEAAPYFEPLGTGDLALPTRAEMQNARV